MHGSWALAGACSTQLTDNYQEVNGLLTMNRAPKADLDELRRATEGRPATSQPGQPSGGLA